MIWSKTHFHKWLKSCLSNRTSLQSHFVNNVKRPINVFSMLNYLEVHAIVHAIHYYYWKLKSLIYSTYSQSQAGGDLNLLYLDHLFARLLVLVLVCACMCVCVWHWRACGSPSSQGAQDPIMPFLAELRMDSGSGMEWRTMAPYSPYSAMTLLRPQHFSRFRHFARRFWNQTWKKPQTIQNPAWKKYDVKPN